MNLNFENIQMAVVRRKSDGSKINISQINEDNRHDEYECIVCGSEVIPVAPNGKVINGENAKVTPHFKHLNAEKCGQESFVHFWMKTEFINIGDKFNVITDKVNEYICNQILFEVAIDIDGRKYIPDATIKTSCGNTIHFEFNYSNKKKIKDYIDRWIKLNHIIVEVNINSMISVFDNSIPTFKALYYEGKCFNLNDEDKLYYNTIGEYKLTEYDKDVLEIREKEMINLDWLWDEIRRIKYENKDYSDIGNLIRSISSEEGRKVAIDILSKIKCGGSILQNYVHHVKSNIDKKLKLLNLKHNGYLIKYETEIPRLIYDRIFKGIIIKFYVLDSDEPEVYQTYEYNFNDEVLSDILKHRIDNVIEELSNIHDLLLNILDLFKNNNKIIDYKLNYKESTDYINAIYFKDYRNKSFVFTKYYYNKKTFIKNNKNIFNGLINDNTLFINLNKIGLYNKNFYIVETEDSYELNNINSYSNNLIKFKLDNFIKQEYINMSYYFVDNSFRFLPRYNFINITFELNNIMKKIEEKIDNIKSNFLNTEYSKYIYKEGETVDIFDYDINRKVNQLLYPIIYFSNRCDSNTLNIRFNKELTRNTSGNLRPWLIKDFIETLKNFDITNINNIY